MASLDNVAGCGIPCILLWRYGNVAAANELLDISIRAGKAETATSEGWRSMTALCYALVSGVMLYILGRDEDAIGVLCCAVPQDILHHAEGEGGCVSALHLGLFCCGAGALSQ